MTEVRAHKAMASYSAKPVESVVISIDEEIPDFEKLKAADEFYLSEATKLESALYGVLPGGTYDRLLGKMLERKSTHFRVSHES